MGLPLDLNKVKETAEKICLQCEKNFKFVVYYDESANVELVKHVLDIVKPSNGLAVDFYSLDNKKSFTKKSIDAALIISGSSEKSLNMYIQGTESKVPCCIVTLEPYIILEDAEKIQYDINVKDIVCPGFTSYSRNKFDEYEIDFSEFNDEMNNAINDRFARWAMRCVGHKVALASRLEVTREHVCASLVQLTAIKNGIIGAIPFFPGSDISIMTFNQAKLVMQITACYGKELDSTMAPKLVLVVLTSYLLKRLSNAPKVNSKLLKSIIRSAFGYAGTFAIGAVAKNYYQAGGTVMGLIKKCKKDIDKAYSNLKYKGWEDSKLLN